MNTIPRLVTDAVGTGQPREMLPRHTSLARIATVEEVYAERERLTSRLIALGRYDTDILMGEWFDDDKLEKWVLTRERATGEMPSRVTVDVSLIHRDVEDQRTWFPLEFEYDAFTLEVLEFVRVPVAPKVWRRIAVFHIQPK